MAGTIPVALSQQFDSNGKPLVGALLYIYAVGTVAQPQFAFQDTALAQALPWPVPADSNGRLPMLYLADGAVHVRLTDANGGVQFDYPSMLVIGPSSGGGGGVVVDPTTIASTGDVKFRATAETLSGWTKMNGQTIGSATSGASGRANSDTQNQFVYLWNNFDNTHCPVIGGRGASALADFNANKQITVLDWRGRGPKGLDDMGNAAAGNFAAVKFAGADTATTPGGLGGENAHTQVVGEMASHNHGVTDPTHSHGAGGSFLITTAGVVWANGSAGTAQNGTNAAATGITINNTGGGAAMNVSELFQLGTWYMRL